jgi:hypothetical protein
MRHVLARFSGVVAGLAGALSGLCGVIALESPAHAQEAYLSRTVPAPSRAFELQMSAGYTQGFGNVFPNHSILDVAGAGMGLTAAVGYRATAHISFEAEGQYQAYSSENAGTSQGLDINLGATIHAMPNRRGDPWLRLASGYRWIWVNNAITGPAGFDTLQANVSFSGWDVVNARIGYDVRPTSGIAWAPVLGANLQTFMLANSRTVSTVQWGTFIYAGLQARFDVGGNTSTMAAAKGHSAD